jgi:type IV pilus assembly protein PilQ
VKLQPVNYANVKEVQKLVKRLLTPRGTVDTDERTNTVIIKDIPSVIDESTALIKAIDTQTPQVMIEARIVEANLDFSQEIGLEWGAGSQPDSDETDFTIGGIKPVTAAGSKFPYNNANNVVVSNPITMTPTGLMNLGSFLTNDQFNVDVRLAAAELNGEGKVISSPRVVTLDNREAMIEQGVSIPFQTFENGDAQLEFIDAVLSLKVTPHITADRSIIMAIEVTRNAPDPSVETPTGSPAIAKNQAKTETLVKDGQTLVLGGIYVIDTAENESRVPYLWKLPILGNAFKNHGTRDRRKELLIFVQPSVVVSPQAAR